MVKFQRLDQKDNITVLIDSNNEVNAMTLAYTVKLGFTTQKPSIGAQKINGSSLEIYNMTIAKFSIQDSLERVQFFEKTLLLADTSMKVILGMLFLSLSNVNV